MRIFNELKGERYDRLTEPYEKYLPEYFGKLGDAYKQYPEALENEEYKLYVHYNKWPIRKLEYSYVISKVEGAVFEGASILDAGCGVSSMPFLWAEFGGDVTAVDFDDKSIALMQRFNDDSFFGNKHICTKVCDIMKLPFEDETFDIVVTTSVLEHLPYPNYLLAISELYRVLKVSGKLICTCDLADNSESKRRAVGAFSVDDIKGILNEFTGEIVEEGLKPQDLLITKDNIEKFWLDHYYDGIGYRGNREYVAVGFCIKKNGVENKKYTLLKYDDLIQKLISYESEVTEQIEKIDRVNCYAREKEVENEKLLQDIKKITAESQQRLEDLNKATAESQKRLLDLNKATAESQNRLDALNIIALEKQQCEEELERVTEENAKRLEAIDYLKVQVETLKSSQVESI